MDVKKLGKLYQRFVVALIINEFLLAYRSVRKAWDDLKTGTVEHVGMRMVYKM